MHEILIREKKWKERYPKLKETIKSCIETEGKHLDFGCGFGCFAYLLAKDYPRMKVIGIDIDKKALRDGKKRYKRKNLKLIATSKIAGKYTSISCCFTLHELNNPKKYVKEFYRRLENNGRILVFDFRKVSRRKFMEWYKKREYIHDSFEKTYKKHCRWNLQELASMFERVGFKTLKMEPVGDYWCLYVGEKMS